MAERKADMFALENMHGEKRAAQLRISLLLYPLPFSSHPSLAVQPTFLEIIPGHQDNERHFGLMLHIINDVPGLRRPSLGQTVLNGRV